jgi:hypothetical protein
VQVLCLLWGQHTGHNTGMWLQVLAQCVLRHQMHLQKDMGTTGRG